MQTATHLRLHHGRSLRPQHFHRLKDVHHALVPHPLQDDAEGDEDSGSAHARAAEQSERGQPRSFAGQTKGRWRREAGIPFLVPMAADGLLDSPTVDRDRPVLAELLLRFMHLTDEVDEAFSRFGNSLFGPVGELELPYRPRLPVLGRDERR